MTTLATAPAASAFVIDEVLAAEIDRVIRAIPATQLKSVDDGVPGLDPAVSADPYSHLGALRRAAGDVVQRIDGMAGPLKVYNAFGHDEAKPNFLVLGHEAIRRMVMDSESFCNSGAYGQHTKALRTLNVTTVNEQDGEEHRATRRLFDQQVFSRKYLVDFAEATIGPCAAHLTARIRGLLARGEPVDLSRDLALPLLYISMSRIVGVPIPDLAHFVDLGERAFGGSRDFAGAQAAVAQLTTFFTDRYEDRKRKGDLDGGDLMSVMHGAERNGRRFSDEEIVVYCRFLLPGGIETTWRQTANLCLAMMLHPAQFQDVVQAPSLVRPAVEEACRWLASGFVLPRIAARDTVLAGVSIRAGSSLVGVFGVANHDERVWEKPDRFDIHRKPRPHLTFSAGPHGCMGQQLARQNLGHALTALARDLPDIELACAAGDVRTSGYQIRCPDAVPVRFAGSSMY